MWGIRRQVSVLLSEGHAQAPRYPIGMVWDECQLVVERQNRAHATEATLVQLAVSSILSKDGAKEFRKTLKRLNESGYE